MDVVAVAADEAVALLASQAFDQCHFTQAQAADRLAYRPGRALVAVQLVGAVQQRAPGVIGFGQRPAFLAVDMELLGQQRQHVRLHCVDQVDQEHRQIELRHPLGEPGQRSETLVARQDGGNGVSHRSRLLAGDIRPLTTGAGEGRVADAWRPPCA